MNILIVEESSPIRKRLLRLLSYIEGIDTIAITANSEEMLERLSGSACDLLIADFSALGLFTLNGISKIKNKNHLKLFIVLADFFSPQIREKYLEYGVDFFLDKANESEQIPQIIESLINKNNQKRHEIIH